MEYTLFVLEKIYIQCTFQNDLLGVIIMVLNIVQYRTTILITTLHSALVLSCFYLPPEAKTFLIGLEEA